MKKTLEDVGVVSLETNGNQDIFKYTAVMLTLRNGGK